MSKATEDWAKMKFGRVITEGELKNRTHPAWPYIYFNPGQPVEKEKVDNLLKGALDLHLHGAPLGGWLPGRPTMVQTCIDASKAGMKALVFKDHNTMVNNCAIIIQDFLTRMQKDAAAKGEVFTPVQVYGGITLNDTVGGMNAKAVEVCLGYGRCKEVWLPSLSAGHQRQAMGLDGGIWVADGDDLTPEMIKVLEVMADYNNNRKNDVVALSTCHVSNEEKVAILKYVKKKGMNVKCIMDHVTQEMTIITLEEAKEMIDLGGYLEYSATAMVPWPGMQDWILAFDYSFNLIKDLIKERGSSQMILTTDAGQPGHEPVPSWSNYIRTCLAQGISERDLEVMIKEVPAMLIGI